MKGSKAPVPAAGNAPVSPPPPPLKRKASGADSDPPHQVQFRVRAGRAKMARVDAFGSDSSDEDDGNGNGNGNGAEARAARAPQPSNLVSLEDAVAKSRRLEQEGSVLAADAQFWHALQRWERAIECTPGRCTLHELKAQVLLELGENFDAIKAATRATELAPGWAPGWLTLGRAQLNWGDLDFAKETFGKAR